MPPLAPRLFAKKKPGDPIYAKDWNRLVEVANRETRGAHVVSDHSGTTILDAPRKKQSILAQIVCEGPDGEANPTNEMYWLQPVDILEGNPSDPSEPPEYDVDANEIFLAANTAEADIHTHGLRFGKIVRAYRERDISGKMRWVFSMMPAIFTILFGGMFNGCGIQRCDNFARLDIDHWSRETLVTDLHEAQQGIGLINDCAWFEGTFWIAGGFSLADGGGTAGYGLAYYDWDTSDFIGVLLGAGEHGGTGWALQVWDDGSGSGDQLFYGQQGGSGGDPALTEMVALDFDPETKAVTVNAVGPTSWGVDVGSSALVHRFFVWDDGQGGGEKLYMVGLFGSGSSFYGIVCWDGTDYATLDGGLHLETEYLYGICAHAFGPEADRGDGSNEYLVVCGRYEQIGSVTNSNHCARYNPFTDAWEKIGITEVVLSGNQSCTAVASFNDRLWLVKGNYDGYGYGQGEIDNFIVIFNGPNTDWLSAYGVIKDMDNVGALAGFTTTMWNGNSNVTVGASLYDLYVYNNRLHVSGSMSWRSAAQGQLKTGPIAWWEDDPDEAIPEFGAWQRVLPLIRGQVRVLLNWDQGLLVGGKYYKALPGGGYIKNLGLWRQTGGVEDAGTWESLGVGGVNGEILAACIFNGELVVAGPFTMIGGVAVKGIARWDGTTWHYVANFSDYGTIYALAVHNGKLVIGGDFLKADGQASLKILCAMSPSGVLEPIIADIDALDGYPIIRALLSYGGYLYAAGWFDDIDSGVTAHAIARMSSVGVWTALEHNVGAPANQGLVTGFQVWSLAVHKPFGEANDWIHVGTDSQAKPNGFGAVAEGLWRWNPATPEWHRGFISVYSWGDEPVRAMAWTPNNDLWVGAFLTATIGQSEPWHEVWWFHPTTINIYRLGGTNGVWESEVLCLDYIDAGQGPRIFGGGNIEVVGTIETRIRRACQLITSIGDNDRIQEVAGGLGVGTYLAQFAQQQFVMRMRAIQFPDISCPSLIAMGVFGTMNDEYSEYLCGVGLDGAIHPASGGLSGEHTGGFNGPVGVMDMTTFDDLDNVGLTLCDHRIGFWWICVGSFEHALNWNISDNDAGLIPESFKCDGIIGFDGIYFRQIVANVPGWGSFKTVCIYDSKINVAGDGTSIWQYTGTPDSGSWAYLIDPYMPGGIDEYSSVNRIRHYPDFHDDMFVLGWLQIYPAASGLSYAFARWNGTAYATESPPGFGPIVSASSPEFYSSTLGDLGNGKRLFCGGNPSTADAIPVVSRTAGGAWAAIGPASGSAGSLKGIAWNVTFVKHPEGVMLYAGGELAVHSGAGWDACDFAKYDPSIDKWEAIGHLNWLGTSTAPAGVGDQYGYTNFDGAMYRFLAGGAFGEIANTAADIGTTNAIWAPGLADYRNPPTRWQTFPGGGGTNGSIYAGEDCGERLFGPQPP